MSRLLCIVITTTRHISTYNLLETFVSPSFFCSNNHFHAQQFEAILINKTPKVKHRIAALWHVIKCYTQHYESVSELVGKISH